MCSDVQTDQVDQAYKAYLLAHGAQDRAHSGGNLWQHLRGVHDILQRAGQSQPVCKAGLFHSVYGTQSFKAITVPKDQRAQVQALIGQRAELLAFAFCELPRPKLLEWALQTHQMPEQITAYAATAQTQITNPHQFLQDLLALECANLLEQRILHPFPALARHAQVLGMLDEEGFPI
jgi:hypothetical protein